MMENEVYDFTENQHDDEDFLSDDELDFLGASEPIDDGEDLTLYYDSFFHAILTGVTLHHNLQKKINLLVEKSANASFNESKSINEETIALSKKMFNAGNTINQLVMATYDFCEKENKFWHGCSLEVYKDYYPVLKENYKTKFPDSEEVDFLKSEYVYFIEEEINGLNTNHNTIALDDKLKLVDYISKLNIDNMEFFNVVKQRKQDFIADEIAKHGFTIEISQKNKIELVKTPERIEDNEDVPLNISNLPKFNLEQRYEIFKQLGFEKTLLSLDTLKKNKNTLLALILGSNVDNAKKLLDGTYKISSDKEKNKMRSAEIIEVVEGFFERNNIKIKK